MKNYLLISFFILIALTRLNAQPHSEIMKCYRSIGNNKTIKLKDGCLLSIGYLGHLSSPSFPSIVSYGEDDYFLMKLDSNYNVIWAKNYGGNGYDYPYSGVELADSSFLIAGYLYDTLAGGLITSRLGMEDGWLIKVDKNGNFLWGKTIGTSDGDILYDICDAGNNQFIITGATFGNDANFTGHHGGIGTHLDWAICKVDSAGNIIWSKQVGGTNNELGNIYIKPVGDGTFMIASITNSNDFDVAATDGLFISPSFAQWIARMDGNGNFIWSKRIGSFSAITENGVYNPIYKDGLFTIPCRIQYNTESVSCSNFTLGDEAVWIVQYDTSGVFKWQTCISGSKEDWPAGICEWNNGFAVAVLSKSNDGDFIVNYGSWDAEVFFIDNVGNKLGQITPYIHPPDNEEEIPIDVLNYRNKILLTFQTHADSTCIKLSNTGGEFTFAEITNWPSGVNDIDPSSSNWDAFIYPNPVDDYFTTAFNNAVKNYPVNLDIYDINGRIVEHHSLHSNRIQLSVGNLSKGIYFAKIQYGKEFKNIKLVVY